MLEKFSISKKMVLTHILVITSFVFILIGAILYSKIMAKDIVNIPKIKYDLDGKAINGIVLNKKDISKVVIEKDNTNSIKSKRNIIIYAEGENEKYKYHFNLNLVYIKDKSGVWKIDFDKILDKKIFCKPSRGPNEKEIENIFKISNIESEWDYSISPIQSVEIKSRNRIEELQEEVLFEVVSKNDLFNYKEVFLSKFDFINNDWQSESIKNVLNTSKYEYIKDQPPISENLLKEFLVEKDFSFYKKNKITIIKDSIKELVINNYEINEMGKNVLIDMNMDVDLKDMTFKVRKVILKLTYQNNNWVIDNIDNENSECYYEFKGIPISMMKKDLSKISIKNETNSYNLMKYNFKNIKINKSEEDMNGNLFYNIDVEFDSLVENFKIDFNLTYELGFDRIYRIKEVSSSKYTCIIN